jgi:hypothetical protein
MDPAPKGVATGFKRVFLWDYSRESSAYGVMVALILAFIFLTPRDVFRDQPRPKTVVQVPAEHGASGFFVDAEQLTGVPEAGQIAAAQKVVRSQPGNKDRNVVRVEAIYDVEKDLRGYMVYTKP